MPKILIFLFLEIFTRIVAHSNGPVFCRSNEPLWAQKSREIAEIFQKWRNKILTFKKCLFSAGISCARNIAHARFLRILRAMGFLSSAQCAINDIFERAQYCARNMRKMRKNAKKRAMGFLFSAQCAMTCACAMAFFVRARKARAHCALIARAMRAHCAHMKSLVGRQRYRLILV